ncbi:MAG: GYD domain-containing protein [Roseiarcus sp.]
MSKYLTLFKYSPDAAKGFLKEKGTGRTATLSKAIENMGGRLESIHWTASGDYSGVVIGHFPDSATYTAFITSVAASGTLSNYQGFELLTAAEVDQAFAKVAPYRAPGT